MTNVFRAVQSGSPLQSNRLVGGAFLDSLQRRRTELAVSRRGSSAHEVTRAQGADWIADSAARPRDGSYGDSDRVADAATLLVAEDVHKRYVGVRALRGASLSVRRGEVHGLVGENGSGKSTLLKILSGQVLPDRATITLDDKPLPRGNPVRSLAAGVATVTQETTLVPDLSVAENILLGRRTVRRWYGLDWGATRERAREVLARLDLEIDPGASVRSLRPDERQMIEIARAISMDSRVLILDEPTSSLTEEEVEALFQVIRNLKQHGVATIFVSHRIGEVLSVSDRITVLRDGNTIATRDAAELDAAGVIELMVGEQLPAVATTVGERPAQSDRGSARLRVAGLTVPGLVEDVSLEVAGGEIVGLAGLLGAGRGEVLKALFGLRRDALGQMELDGRRIDNGTPAEAMRSGLAYVPAERKELGLVLDMTTRENLMMAGSAAEGRLRRPPRARELALVEEAVERFRVSGTAANGAPVSALSGGNQQKVVLAKWMGIGPKAIMLDEPTRGVDVGAKAEIYKLLQGLRGKGLAILVSSSETRELLTLCDRILVMFRGRVVAELPAAEATEATIAGYASGHG